MNRMRTPGNASKVLLGALILFLYWANKMDIFKNFLGIYLLRGDSVGKMMGEEV